MRILNTIACAGLAAAIAIPAVDAQTRTQSDTVHPVLQVRPPRDVLNSDLLDLSERERRAWIHGAVAQMTQTLSELNAEAGRCVLYWYFEEGNGPESIPLAMEKFPDAPATATIWALARRACPQL